VRSQKSTGNVRSWVCDGYRCGSAKSQARAGLVGCGEVVMVDDSRLGVTMTEFIKTDRTV
jgi:hypothetical protein